MTYTVILDTISECWIKKKCR